MDTSFDNLPFRPADILLPQDCDYDKWAVVACDQYTSQPEYWQRVEERVGRAPSALRLILPESSLDGPQVEMDIMDINATMARYVREGRFKTLPGAMIYVERVLHGGKVRRGLVGMADLKDYDYEPGSDARIRATEGVVMPRIPPRVAVRKNAPIELPHAMLLADDPGRTVIEPLAAQTDAMELLYDFDLMEQGGHIRGWRLGEEQLAQAKEDAYEQADMTNILTVDTIKSLLTAQNFSMPAGYVTEEGVSYMVRLGDKPSTVEELQALPLMDLHMDGVPVITLGDVADVFYTDNSADIYANVDGSAGVMLTIQKQTGYSTGEVSDRLAERFEEMMGANGDLSLITLMDQGIYIDLVMDAILNNILFGGGLAILILILFLKDIRPTLVVAFSIPISLVTAIVCMYFSGVTLNIISLSGLALGIGMLVDNSIVVIENIYRLRSQGASVREAAIAGAQEVAGAIMASTLTTVCVFLPIVFTEGITRQLFVDMGLTIAYSLLASLLIALTVVPAMSSGVFSRVRPQKESRFFGGLMRGYGKTLELALRFKPIVLVLVLVLLLVSMKAAFSRGTAFMPDMDSTQISMTLSLPKDTPLSETADATDSVIGRLREMQEVTDVGAMASSSTMSMLSGGGNSATNETTMYISLREDKERDNVEIARDIEENIADILEAYQAEASIETSTMDMSAMGGSGITIQIKGRELDTLQEIARDIAAIVEGVEGTTEVSDGLEESTGELRILIDRDKAIEHGITVAQIFQQIQARLADAASATTLETEIEEYSVYVKHANDIELTRDLVKDLELDRQKQDGTKETIKLSDIARFESTEAPKAVNRVDQTRYIAVSAAIAEKNGLTKDSINWIVPHQANVRIIEAVAHRMEVPMDKVLVNIEHYGNTSAATLPLCIWDFEDKLKKGDNIIFTAFGAGFTWGAVYVKWGYDGKKES